MTFQQALKEALLAVADVAWRVGVVVAVLLGPTLVAVAAPGTNPYVGLAILAVLQTTAIVMIVGLVKWLDAR